MRRQQNHHPTRPRHHRRVRAPHQEEFLRAGGDRFTVVLPGDEPLEFRVFLCRGAEEAASCLQRHWWEKEGRAR